MITQNEINTVELSPTKKDFREIWTELLDIADKLSERWSPVSTNEADPSIVLLKVLTAIADKINYNIDNNTLEAFMPSASQQESMRALTEMLGYSMKYYQSATTTARISYNTNNNDRIPASVLVDRFSNIKDIDDTINYVTIEPINLSQDVPSKTVNCIEGELILCETDDNNIVSMLQLDDSNRYFLPETMIAENGIFINNISDGIESTEFWTKVDNLNTQAVGTKCFKFGYSSTEGLPYIQFPDDISTIIEDGVRIRYIRTNGVSGNISAGRLSKLEKPISWPTDSEEGSYDYYNVDNYTISNLAASTNGANIETLNNAYNNFKKTVGTFDTLVTCRDYMNRIYQMTISETDTTPLVSNVIVSDIRDDINKSLTLCTFTEHGTEYKNISKLKYDEEGNVVGNLINHYDLILYPFRTVTGLNNKNEFDNSFKYDNSYLYDIKQQLENNKTISHNFINPTQEDSDIVCIKNYLNLSAKITTNGKVGIIEQNDILANVYKAIYSNFNMRQLDFGEEIPYETLLQVISSADTRIRSVILDEPELSTAFCTVNGTEYHLGEATSKETDEEALTRTTTAKAAYNKLALNNVLAGRIPLFNYYTDFQPSYDEAPIEGSETILPDNLGENNKPIYIIKPSFTIDKGCKDVALKENEVVQFRLPNLKTTVTYPAYVNYFIKLKDSNSTDAVPATMQTLREFIENERPANEDGWEYYANLDSFSKSPRFYEHVIFDIEDSTEYNVCIQMIKDELSNTNNVNKIYLVKDTTNAYKHLTLNNISTLIPEASDYKKNISENIFNFVLNENNALQWHLNIQNLKTIYYHTITKNSTDELTEITASEQKPIPSDYKRAGLYTVYSTNTKNAIGNLVDAEYRKFRLFTQALKLTSVDDSFTKYFVAKLWDSDTNNPITENDSYLDPATHHTKNGLGKSADLNGLSINSQYKLKEGEYLLINYTSSSTEDNTSGNIINTYYGEGTIIRPNFELIDSAHYHINHSYNKTSGFSFADAPVPEQPAGLFTLGANEQIEIREIASVKLDKNNTYLYWQRNDENSYINTYADVKFKFDEDPVYKEGSKEVDHYTAYTLKEGEYLCYTDANKTDFAYYGAGTVIKIHGDVQISKKKDTQQVSLSDIITLGLAATIPWKSYRFNENRYIEIQEYQYTNLNEGNVLRTISTVDSTEDADTIDLSINGEWQAITGATYALTSVEDKKDASSLTSATESLPAVDFRDNIESTDSVSWQVRSLLRLNVGPTTSQTLHISKQTTDSPTNSYHTRDDISLYTIINGDTENPKEIFSTKDKDYYTSDMPLSFKTNKLIQSANTEIPTVYIKVDSENRAIDYITDLKIKLFNLIEDLYTANNTEGININAFGDNYTRLTYSTEALSSDSGMTPKETSHLDLRVLLPKGYFGLVMFYNSKINSETGEGKNTYLKFNNTADDSLTIYNKNSWWTKDDSETVNPNTIGYVDKDKYFLRNGINIVKIPASGTLSIYAGAPNNDVVIFSDLDIVPNGNDGINPAINYQLIEDINSGDEPQITKTLEETILGDIKLLDPNYDFYFNNIPSNDLVIDLNGTTLDDPRNYYDKNNINNKFVISEINTDAMLDTTSGITIAKSSMR